MIQSTDPVIEGPRGCRPHEFGETLDLMNYVFRCHRGRRPSMGGDFPHLYNVGNAENLRVLRENGTIVSHVGIYPADVRIGSSQIRVGAVGGVATDPDCQGRGYAKKCLRDSIDHMRKAGFDASILWTGIDDFYRTLGWETAGALVRYKIDSDTVGKFPQVTQSDISDGVTEMVVDGIKKIHDECPHGLVRNTELTRLMLGRVRHTTFLLHRDSRPLSYIVVNLAGAVRDYGGDATGVQGLVRHVMEKRDWSETIITTPPKDDPLKDQLDTMGIHGQEDFAGMICVINLRSLLDKIGLSDVAIEDNRGEVTLTRGSEKVTTTPICLSRLIFGPDQPEQFASDILPINIFWSELDHM